MTRDDVESDLGVARAVGLATQERGCDHREGRDRGTQEEEVCIRVVYIYRLLTSRVARVVCPRSIPKIPNFLHVRPKMRHFTR
jgi:hypothetical protein